MEIVTVLHGLIIVSMMYAPAPWITLKGGYSEPALILSTSAGAVLGTLAFATAVLNWMTLRTYLVCAGVVGVGCLVYGLFGQPVGSAPSVIFLAYGVLLTTSSLTAKTRRVGVVEEPGKVVPFPERKAARPAAEEERRRRRAA